MEGINKTRLEKDYPFRRLQVDFVAVIEYICCDNKS